MQAPTTIDRAGRIVIPKALRERFGLHPGTPVEIRAGYSGIEIRLVASSGPTDAFFVADNVLVYGGPLPDDVAAAVERDREERLSALARTDVDAG